MNQKEIWKPIIGYEGYYEISNLCRVRSIERYVEWNGHLRHVPSRIKLQHHNKQGYLTVTLCKDCKSRMKLVHRLLMETFVPNPDGKPEIDHINTIRDDNRLENLRWVSSKENSSNPLTLQHGRETNYTKERNNKMVQTKIERGLIKEIFQYTLDGTFVACFRSCRQAMMKTGITSSQILLVLDDNTQSAGGFLWLSHKKDGICYVPRIHPTSKAVLHYDVNGNLLGEYQSIIKASKATGLTRTTIYRSLIGKFKRPRKYIFRFKDNPL